MAGGGAPLTAWRGAGAGVPAAGRLAPGPRPVLALLGPPGDPVSWAVLAAADDDDEDREDEDDEDDEDELDTRMSSILLTSLSIELSLPPPRRLLPLLAPVLLFPAPVLLLPTLEPLLLAPVLLLPAPVASSLISVMRGTRIVESMLAATGVRAGSSSGVG